MAVLSRKKIIKRLTSNKDLFNVTPILDWKKQLSNSAIDLRLDNQFIIISRSQFSSLNPTRIDEIKSNIWQYQKKITIAYGNKFVLHPNELVIGSTIEYLSFPKDLTADVIGRSSWGRLGLIIATATIINPGFQGNLTLELVNLGNVPIILYPGVRIAQIVLHEIKDPIKIKDKSKYQMQIEPGFSKIYEDPELTFINPIKCKIIVGLTGFSGSGKKIISNLFVENESFKYYSLSHIVKKMFYETHLRKGNRTELQDFGDKIRLESKKPDYFAREVLKEIQKNHPRPTDKILIDGIKNPSEVKLLKSLSNFYLLGIEVNEKKILENLRRRGYLITEKDRTVIINELKKETDTDRRIELKKRLKMAITEKIFYDNLIRDKGEGKTKADKLGFGQNVQGCMALVDNKIDFNKSEVEAKLMFYKIVHEMEGFI